MFATVFDPRVWAAVPFGFWCVAIFVFGSVVGSFLNVCIHRLPLGESIVFPPSHCPHCKYSIPWYLNVPLFTWLYLKARCRHCGARISGRYFLVELLTAALFLGSWLAFGRDSAVVALVICGFLAGLVVASFIDFEHFIIPDELTLGGLVVGFLCSVLVPGLHRTSSVGGALKQSVLGALVGAGVIYLILRIGKLLFGRQRVVLPADTRIVFTETSVVLPDKEVLYEDLFYRPSDAIVLRASRVELVDRCGRDVIIRLSPNRLTIGDEEFDPNLVPVLEAVSAEIVLPREAMGLGDVKFMGAIGAFLGWKAVLFSLMVSSMIGSVVGVTLIVLGKRAWSSRLPYGPYIAVAAALWLLGGWRVAAYWFGP